MHRVFALFLFAVVAVGTWSGAPCAANDLVAERGCWPMRDGTPARTCATATQPVLGPLAAAWTFEPKGRNAGRLLGPPRVHRERVAVAVLVGDAHVNLHLLRLGDGAPLVRSVVLKEKDELLEFDFMFDMHGLVAHERREGKDGPYSRISLWRVSRGKLRKRWTADDEGAAFDIVRKDERVVVARPGALVCYDTTQDREVWRRTGNFHGHLSAANGVVYAVLVDEHGNGMLTATDLHTGDAIKKVHIGNPQRVRGERNPFHIVVTKHRVFVHSPKCPFPSSKKKLFPTSVVTRGLKFDALIRFVSPVVAVGDGAVVRAQDAPGRVELLHGKYEKDEMAWYPLADSNRHTRFTRRKAHITAYPSVVQSGLDLFDPSSRHILREQDATMAFRPVPARRTVLVSPDGRKLVAMRSADAMQEPGIHLLGTDGKPRASAKRGVVAFSTGDRHTGAFRIDGDHVVAVEGPADKAKETRHALSSVRVATGDDDVLVYVRTMDDLVPALVELEESSQAKAYFKLVKDAYRAQDADLMQRYIEIAADRGVDARDLRHRRKQVHMLRKRNAKPKDKKVKELEAREQALRDEVPVLVDRVLESALDDARPEVREAVMPVVLARKPKHPRVLEYALTGLPAWIRPKGGPQDAADALAWMELGDALKHTPVVQVPEPVGDKLSIHQRLLGQARHLWRKDLVALRSDRLLVLTPLTKPGRITRCVSMGELVCTALETLFKHGKHVRTDPWPMILHLFETKDEYLKASGGKEMEWSSGHFDSAESLSRIFLPEGKDAFNYVMKVYAHELTHHWLAERCPLYTDREQRRSVGQPGYWIVEGFADFVEEFAWDLGNRSWDTFDPRCESLDAVANAPSEALHPWPDLYAYSHLAFNRLSKKNDKKVPSRWRLGTYSLMSAGSMFYRQAAATVNYLYHASPELRAGLIAFVHAHYTGKMPAAEKCIPHFFGMDARTLGHKVLTYARGVQEGQAPTHR